MRRVLPSRRPPIAVRPWRPSALWRLLRRPLIWWGAAAVLAVTTAAATQRLVADARAQRDAWADRQVVVVTSEGIEAGSPVTSDNTKLAELPAVALPDGFLSEIPTGATAAVAMTRGEIVHPARLIGGRRNDDERVAIAVPVGDLAGLVAVGDIVDVWAATDTYGVEPGPATSRLLADAAAVIDLADGVALLAIDEREVATVAASLPIASVTVTIVSRSAE